METDRRLGVDAPAIRLEHARARLISRYPPRTVVQSWQSQIAATRASLERHSLGCASLQTSQPVTQTAMDILTAAGNQNCVASPQNEL